MQCRMGIVVPVFNEAHRWDIDYWKQMIQTNSCLWVFVDDGSTDNTSTLLFETRKVTTESRVLIVKHDKNQGKGAAVRTGFLTILKDGLNRGDWIGFLDADCAFTVHDVSRMVRMAIDPSGSRADIDAYWSSRVALSGRNIQRDTRRHYLGRAVNTLISLRHNPLPYDTQSGLKVFRVCDALVSTLSTPFQTRWFFDLEILLRCRLSNEPLKIWEEPLESWHDVPGSRLRGKEIARILRETLKVMVM